MRFFWNNLIDGSSVVMTASSEVATLPGTNIANEFRTKVWRTGTSTAAESIVIDLASAQAVTGVILLDHTLTASDSAIALEGNTSDSWGAPAFSQSLTFATSIISSTFASQSYRYWRIKFTKSAAGESRDIGRVFLGTYLEPTDIPDYDGYSQSLEDLSRKTKSRTGPTWVDRQDQFLRFDISCSRFGQTDVDNIKTMFDTVGQSKSLFFQCATSSPLNTIRYVKFARRFEPAVSAYNGAFLWDFGLEMEEQL